MNGITISVYRYDIVDISGHGGWGGMILDGPFWPWNSLKLELQTQWSDVGLEMRVTLNIISTSPRNRTQPLKFPAIRIWTHFLQVFEQENSVSWSAN